MGHITGEWGRDVVDWDVTPQIAAPCTPDPHCAVHEASSNTPKKGWGRLNRDLEAAHIPVSARLDNHTSTGGRQ